MSLRDTGTRLVPPPSHDPVAAINVTPMIDVLMVLLIVFMITVSFSRHSNQVHLVRPSSPAPVYHQIVLELSAGGEYLVNQQSVPEHQLGDLLAGLFRNRPVKILFIRTDRDRTYQDFITAADIARGAGVTTIAEMPGR
jgi:biopolymer transport protein ExbD